MNRALPIPRVVIVMAAVAIGASVRAGDASAQSTYKDTIRPLLKARCVRCHGPNAPEGGLDLSRAATLLRGGDSGPALADGATESLLWQRVHAGEMPPDEPLSPEEQETLRAWISAGAPGLDAAAAAGDGHWAFAPLRMPAVPDVPGGMGGPANPVRTVVDAHLQSSLATRRLALSPDADRATLARRVSFVLTGLPPTPEEVAAFVADPAADAYEQLVDRLLASPHYGEHWGKHWLDAAGYADTNGYFGKESDRAHAWRYRDYVVASINADKPFDRFVREQLAGDELTGVTPGSTVTHEERELLVATHFLRNGPDGTDDSAPSPEAQRIDRYAALEAAEQVVYTSLLGLTIKCARCHDHKFEPLTQREYYEAQAILYPAFNPEQWVKPRERVIHAATVDERAAWEANRAAVEVRLATVRDEHRSWVARHRQRGREVFRAADLPDWTPAPTGSPPARRDASGLVVVADVESWLATAPIEWIDPEVGGAVEVTFDLVADRIGPTDAASTAFGYVVAATDVHGSAPGQAGGGNILVEGRPTGGPRAYRLRNATDPEARRESLGDLGRAAYRPGSSYGVRVTNLGAGKCRVEHLVDHAIDGEPLVLDHADLPRAPFAFWRSPGGFIVADVAVERHAPPAPYRGEVLFVDDGTRPVADLWSEAAPGDAAPDLPVLLASAVPNRHSADRRGTRLRIVSGMSGESWLCTQRRFDWTPDAVGRSIQVSFRLVDTAIDLPGAGGRSRPTGHVGYVLGAHNFGRRRADAPGNLRVEESAAEPTQVFRDDPDGPAAAPLGAERLATGRRYGARVTNVGGGAYHLVRLVDDVPDGAPVTLSAADLPDGGFAFTYGAGRSFVVESVIVTAGDLAPFDDPAAADRGRAFAARAREHRDVVEKLEKESATPAGMAIAWVSDGSAEPPPVFLLHRGLYDDRGEEVKPAGLAALADADNPFAVEPPATGRTTGRRLALADWMLRPGSRPRALAARVRANWIWLHCFGTGLSTTPENLGLSGMEPSHPELLEFLAAEFERSGWSLKHMLRLVLRSTAFRQSSAPHAAGLAADPANRLLWRFPVQRLDAESIRDAMLTIGGALDDAIGGPPVMLQGLDGHGATGEVEPCEPPGQQRRTLYVQRRRSALPTFLQVFDLPGITATCADRPRSTVALQSLAQLNSAFSRSRAAALADRLGATADDDARIRLAFMLCTAHEPSPEERAAALGFLRSQREVYAPAADAARRALVDFCQIMFVSNAFLYVE